MATTPPPRLQTPPPDSLSNLRVPSAPLHGAKYDQYEPYPPRFSTRIASQRAARSMERTPEPVCPSSPSKMRSRGSPRKYPRVDGETDQSWKSIRKEAFGQQSDSSLSTSEPISEISGYPQRLSSSVSHRHPSSLSHPRPAATQALPTPAKTPSKRTIQGDLSSTSRTLFPSTGKMSSKKPSPFSLESFETSSSNEIQIFTDSRDRIPTSGPTSGNPFSSQADSPVKKGKKAAARMQGAGEGASSQRTSVTTPRRHHQSSSSEEDHSPNSDEGITMIFRGKKVFTKFADLDEQDDDEDDLGLFASRPDLLAANPDILHRVKPLTRSSIKPRVLFPAAIKSSPPLEEEDATDEEDAEVAEAQIPEAQIPHITTKTPAVTPKSPQAPQAPGSTRLLRSNARLTAQDEETPTGTNAAAKRKRISPFDQWLRKKQAIEESSSPAPSTKREADLSGESPLTPPSAKKTRTTRAGASTASST
ncbi:uncharacterized protein N7496_001705 [Penicillium cataractarum]|uniref:Uncharacterized protein n=1 Tax=Penicillium cataractarum TaxID=2100454 RepID=A0A9X0B7A9_9EURO|nr:uncharacterized protein N7496_001705 [Penicillium cataractarum]KAJ5390637.1 hypothetical protein N7496_001705 [Penicillium cataractarum]